MMRKLAAVMAALIWGVLNLSVCALAGPEEADSLLERAVVMAEETCRLATNDAYWLAMTDNEQISGLGKAWASGHDARPALVVQLAGEAEVIELLATQGSAALGAEALTAWSITRSFGRRIFACDDVGDGAYLLMYESAAPVLAVWHSEDGAVRMQSMLLPWEELAACATEAEVSAWFGQLLTPMAEAVAAYAALDETYQQLARAFSSVRIVPTADLPVSVSQPNDADATEKALGAAAEMDAQAMDRAALMGLSADMTAMLAEWSAGDAEKPVLTVMAELPLESELVRGLISQLPPGTGIDDQALLMAGVSAVPTMLAGRQGPMQLAASSVASRTILFADSVNPFTGLYLFIYEDKLPIMVSSCASEGAVSMTAAYLPIGALGSCRTIEDVNRFFEDAALPLPWALAESSR